MRSKKLFLGLSVVVVVFVVFLAGIFTGFALVPPENTFTFSSGVYSGSNSFTIYQFNASYYAAKDCYGVNKYVSQDATVVIQGAIDSLDGNGKIFFRSGTYYVTGLYVGVSGVLDNVAQNLILEGEDKGTTILKLLVGAVGVTSAVGGDSTRAMLYAESSDTNGVRLTVRNLEFCGQRQSQSSNVAGIVVRHGRNCLIENNFIFNVSKWGVAMLDVNYAYRENNIRYNDIYDVNDYDGSPSAPLGVNCVGIYTAPRSDIYIVGNKVGWVGFNSTTGDAVGYGINLGDSDQAKDNTVWAVGVGIYTTPDSKHHQICDNYLDFCFNASVFLSSAIYSTVQNNIIRIPYQDGIRIENSLYNLIQGNRIYNIAGYSTLDLINELGTSDYNTIIDNDLNYNGTVSWTKVYLNGTHTVLKGNAGFVTENSGLAVVSNGDSISTGLDSTVPSAVFLLTALDATYGGIPVVVSCNSGSSSVGSIVVGVYWVNGTAITNDINVAWSAERNPVIPHG